MGFTQKLGGWVPHELTQKQKDKRLSIAAQNLARHQGTHGHRQRFLYRIVTGDEKWCLYVNMKQRKEWVSPGEKPKPRIKKDLHPMTSFYLRYHFSRFCKRFALLIVFYINSFGYYRHSAGYFDLNIFIYIPSIIIKFINF